jgi:hypothetical protein
MLAPTQKPAPALIHHPWTVLDDLCAFSLANEAWARFDQQISEQVAAFEEDHRQNFTPNAVRKSLGRK